MALVTETVEEADFVLSATDVAVMVMVLLVGTAVGAVKSVAVPLPVLAAESEPQEPALPQVTVQLTPEFVLSLLTSAVNAALPPTCKKAGVGLSVTAIGAGAVMVIVADAEALLFATDVAVTVTVLELGTAEGAV